MDTYFRHECDQGIEIIGAIFPLHIVTGYAGMATASNANRNGF
ncbi:PblB-type protein [Salmonella phage 19]|nr:PblB-type protein [Salmonella phage 19]